jgi:prepilin-type N-terminal cleavage/methylation domain-containing protein
MNKTKRREQSKGFTIVEIVVVVVVLSILSTIGYFAIQGWRTRTAQGEVSSDLNQAVSAMEAARTFSSGYPASIPTTFKASANVTVTLKTVTATSFCMEGASKVVPSVVYKATNTSKTPVSGTC